MARKPFDRFMVTHDAALNPKIRRLKSAGPEVRWAWFHGVLAIASAARVRGQFTIGHVPADERDVAHMADVTLNQARKALAAARDMGMLIPTEDGIEVIHDWDDWQVTPRSAPLDPNGARRQALYRNPELRQTIRDRDDDRCRYCAVVVDFADRRGLTGGTYDHVDPAEGNTAENLVVACRSCNSAKGSRTPEEAGMRLLPIKSESSSRLSSSATPFHEVEVEVEVEVETPIGSPAADAANDDGQVRHIDTARDRLKTESVDRVWHAYVDTREAVLGPRSTPTLTPERRKLIAGRLARYPEADVVDAVKGWRHFPHNRGENENGRHYCDVELVLRINQQTNNLERFRDAEREHGTADRRVLAKLLAGDSGPSPKLQALLAREAAQRAAEGTS